MTKSVTFRLSDDDIELLEAIAAKKKNKTDAIRYALQQANNALQGNTQQEGQDPEFLIEQLRAKDKQIDEKDRQIERMQQEHMEAMRAIQQAQTLHHEEREQKQLETAEANMTRWQRFTKWLKG